MTAPKEIGQHLVALTCLRDLVDREITAVREDMSAALLAVQAETGADRIVVTLPGPDGPEKVAAVSLVKETASEPGFDIDPIALAAWVLERAPDEVYWAVRDPYRRALLGNLEVCGDDVIDTKSGEVVDFAKPRPAKPAEPTGKFTLRFEGGTNGTGRERVAQAWRDGELAHVLAGVAAAAALPGGAS